MKCQLNCRGNIYFVPFSHFQLFNLFLGLASEHSSIYPDQPLACDLKRLADTNLIGSEYVWMITSMFWLLQFCLCRTVLVFNHSTMSLSLGDAGSQTNVGIMQTWVWILSSLVGFGSWVGVLVKDNIFYLSYLKLKDSRGGLMEPKEEWSWVSGSARTRDWSSIANLGNSLSLLPPQTCFIFWLHMVFLSFVVDMTGKAKPRRA